MAGNTQNETVPPSADLKNKPAIASFRPLSVLVLVVLAVVVWLLPSIAAKTPLLQWGVNKAAADLKGTVTVKSASLGWFSPVSAEGIEVKDSEGRPVLDLPTAVGDRWLISILCNYTKLGRYRLQKPQLSLVLRDDGSNVEDLLAKYLTSDEKSSSSFGIGLEVIDGNIDVTDFRIGRRWHVQKLDAGFEMSETANGPMEAKLSADLPDAKRPGKITVGWKSSADGSSASLKLANLPLALFRPLAARFSPGTVCDGRLSSNITVAWSGSDAGKNSIQADLDTEVLSMTATALQTDVVQLERLHGVCQASWQGNSIEIEKTSVDCDLGSLALTSTVKRDPKNGISMQSLAHDRHELTGRIDLARLARLLPATLQVRRGVEISSGQVQVALSSRPEQQGMKWHGQLDAAGLAATASGRPITWEHPLAILVDAHETAEGPFVDTLQCESDFLKVHASGTPDRLAASMSFNLKKLSDQLGQFVEMGSLQLAGEGIGNLNWQRTPQKAFDAGAEFQVRNFQLALPNQQPWIERELVATLSAKGQTNLNVDTRIDAAAASLKAGEDQIDVQLAQPVQNLRDGGAWPVHVRAQGQLQNWPSRLAAWLPTQNCQLTGAYALEADGTASSQSVEVRQVRMAAAPLVVHSPWLLVNEPRIDVSAAGSWNQAERRLKVEPANLTCATAEIQANNFVWASPEKGPAELGGTLQFRGDAARVRTWLCDPKTAADWRMAGQFKGTVQLNQTAGVIQGETTAELLNLAVIDASGQQFQEPSIRLAGRGNYEKKSGNVQIERMEITSDVINANAAGRITPVAGVNNADIQGQFGCDMERLAGLLRPYLVPGVRIVGRSDSADYYRGPFTWADGRAAVGLHWNVANIYGLQLSRGDLKASMADGVASIEPIDLAVSQGKIHLAPSVRLTSKSFELTLPKGPFAQQIQVDPAICTSSLKYIAPNLADITSAKGSFSIDLENCRIPLGKPSDSDVTGRLIVHSMNVGTGPLARTFATFLNRESPAQLRPQSVVQFRMYQRKIYHQGLELVFPEFSVRTQGWVGLDQKMGLLAEMPVPPKWVAQNPTLSDAMRRQVIRIPVNGTLSKPALDQKAVADLSRQFLQKAAQNVIEGEVNRQLDRLFGPQK